MTHSDSQATNARANSGVGGRAASTLAAEAESVVLELETLAELNAELNAEAEGLRSQVKALVRTEGKLYKIQEQLDLQIKIFRKLYQLGQTINATFSVDDILVEIPKFVLYELGYQRALVLLREPGESKLRIRALDGYYDEELEEELRSITLDVTHPLPDLAAVRGKLVHRHQAPLPEISSIAEHIKLENFIAFPLFGQESLIGVLIGGNTQEEEEYYVAVDGESEAAYGLANLAGQVAAAIHSAFLYRELADERNLLERNVQERTAELSEAYRNLEKLAEQKSQFFANVSHELRTPLTLSLGPLERLLHSPEKIDPKSQRRHLEMMYHNQLRLLKLINDLLDFAKIDAGRMNVMFRREEVIRTLRYYVATIESAAQARGMTVGFDSDVEKAELYLDHDKFEKIIMNLLSNAFKFTPDGGKITVSISDCNTSYVIVVSDSGVGIPAEALPKIFERFSQVDGSEKRRYAGTGIGLAMVQEYVHVHGGSVHVASTPGEGTSFSLTFLKGCAHLDPKLISDDATSTEESVEAVHKVEFLAGEASDDPDEMDDGGPSVAPPCAIEGEAAEDVGTLLIETAERATVLVVDDVTDMRQFISHILADEYRVITAKDGQEGLEKALRLGPDLIVSDVMMPRMTGFELLDALRTTRGPISRTPVILVSARADLAKRIEGLDHGADDYLYKPFNATELASRVRNLIRLRRSERQLMVALAGLRDRDARMTADLQQARDFQQSILPPIPSVAGLGVDVEYRPTDLVGGDYYDLMPLLASESLQSGAEGSEILRVFIADATGHGIKASLATMFIKIEFDRVKALDGGPARVLQALNDIIAGRYGHLSLRFTAVCADIDGTTGVVRYSTAAHPAPLVVRATTVSECDAGGSFVGLLSGIEFPEYVCQLDEGDSFFLFTDGITEEWSEEGGEFECERLMATLAESRDRGESLAQSAYATVMAYAGGKEKLEDDATCIAIRWKP